MIAKPPGGHYLKRLNNSNNGTTLTYEIQYLEYLFQWDQTEISDQTSTNGTQTELNPTPFK